MQSPQVFCECGSLAAKLRTLCGALRAAFSASPPIQFLFPPRFSFTRALRLLLNGLDAQRMKSDAQERFRRHGLKVVKSIKCEGLARPSVTAQYAARARELYGVDVEVLDLGQMCLCC